MKTPLGRLVFVLVAVVVGAVAAYFWNRSKAPQPAPAVPPPVAVVPPASPVSTTVPTTTAPKSNVAATTAAPSNVVPIQDGKTIDFSSGKPVVKDDAQEKAIMAKAEKEMEEASKEITFGPAPKTAAPPTPPAPK